MDTFNSKRELEEQVMQYENVLILFCASWCPFCRQFFPVFDNASSKFGFDKILRVYIDDDDNKLWEEYELEAVPTVAVFRNGKVARRLDSRLGFGLNENDFVRWLQRI